MPGPEGDNEVIFLRNSHLEDSLVWLIELGRQAQGRKEPGKKGEHRGQGEQGRWGSLYLHTPLGLMQQWPAALP